MTKKARRSPSFDAMIKFFLKHYNFATKQDIQKLIKKIEDLEKSVARLASNRKSSRTARTAGSEKTASDIVLDVIKASNNGADLNAIQRKTAFEEKKLRNIIYRLSKQDKIRRIRRGIYVSA